MKEIKNREYTDVFDFINAFPNEKECIEHLSELKWEGNIVSPFDPLSKVYKCSDGRYKCRNTNKYFTVKTGTIFEGSKIPLAKWFYAIWLYNEIPVKSSYELGDKLGISQRSACRVLNIIKKIFTDENE